MTPKEVSRKENENKVWRNLYPEFVVRPWHHNFRLVIMLEWQWKRKHLIKNTLKDGRKRFSKFPKFNWPFQWHIKLTDYNGEEIQGSFYEQELQKTKQDIFMIEKIKRQQGSKVLLNGWVIMIRLTRGLITKTLTNYGAKVYNVRYCLAWLSQVFPWSVPYDILQSFLACGWTHNFRLHYVELPRVSLKIKNLILENKQLSLLTATYVVEFYDRGLWPPAMLSSLFI